uniref:Cullin family profile domain-containing protein n=3 Tax=Kalanchoe fedtschenkoi TaxID=63787 RepID=A0A7N0T7N4_KALFE
MLLRICNVDAWQLRLVEKMDVVCNLGALDDNSIQAILNSWEGFTTCTESLLAGNGDLSVSSEFVSNVHTLCKHGLDSLVREHFLVSLEDAFEKNGASKFWLRFESYRQMHSHADDNEVEDTLREALEEISLEKRYQEKCLLILVHGLQSYKDYDDDSERIHLVNNYQLNVSSVLMASLPRHFPEILQCCFKKWLEELSTLLTEEMDADDMEEEMDVDHQSNPVERAGEMDIDITNKSEKTHKLVRNIGKVVRDLRGLGFTSMAEDAYASAIFSLLKSKVHDFAGDEFRISVLQSVKGWIQAVPLQFLRALLAFLGESVRYSSPSSSLKSPLASHPSSCYPGIETPSEGLVRWQLRLEYFAYETLQDLRIAKLFEIIVDYPESSPAIEDLKQCLEYTGQHSKLVDSFVSALRYRLLTAGASTNDILHQYVSTIKALRTMDPAGIFLESVGEPISDYLRGRKDTIKCIVTMLTDGSGGNSNAPGSSGESLLEELNRDEEEQEDAGADEEINTDDRQAWINTQRWEPDPVEADPSKGSNSGSNSRRKVDILGMIVSIIGSKDQLVNEYRVMLAEKLLNKSGYDIEAEIRTLELLKLHFGEGSLQKCEIMLNDLIDSKRTNSNIKATVNQPSQPNEEATVPLDVIDATIISSNFWPPIQVI